MNKQVKVLSMVICMKSGFVEMSLKSKCDSVYKSTQNKSSMMLVKMISHNILLKWINKYFIGLTSCCRHAFRFVSSIRSDV